jgi:polyhydroxyalkanoate synthase
MLDWSHRVVEIGNAAVNAAASIAGLDAVRGQFRPAPQLAPTPRHAIYTEGTATLFHFDPAGTGVPILLIPSLINRGYVLDLRTGASLVEALTASGRDTWLLDWGIPEAEDRYLSWSDILARLDRAVRRVMRLTGAPKIALLGYCMGGTLATIDAALHPGRVAALIDLCGPIDFSAGGALRHMVDPRWFDAGAIADAGNVAPAQMQAGFVALRPTVDLSKLVAMPDLVGDDRAQTAFRALDAWASDNIPFPGEAYRTYITELYQGNALVRGGHRVRGQRVDLKRIEAPTLAIVADRDAICPADAATALLAHVGTPAEHKHTLRVPGGHVGAVVGTRAAREMYPALISWLKNKIS